MMIFQVGRVIGTSINCYLNECTFLCFLICCVYIIYRIFLLVVLIQCCFLTANGVLCRDIFNYRMSEKINPSLVLANEDTLLQTHCCSWCFLARANWETFAADIKCFWTKSETFFVSQTQNLCPQQMLRARANGGTFVSATMCPRLPVALNSGTNIFV